MYARVCVYACAYVCVRVCVCVCVCVCMRGSDEMQSSNQSLKGTLKSTGTVPMDTYNAPLQKSTYLSYHVCILKYTLTTHVETHT